MGIRKNAKFLTAAEKENYVKACVLMKADIVNPGAPAADRYSKWDEYVAVHSGIQNVLTPPGGSPPVNFGHGGLLAYSFLSWHRYFLYRFELDLQSHVPGVMIPYWDWTDPTPLMVDTFVGPSGGGPSNWVQQGYFAYNKPGSPATPANGGIPALPANATAKPAWWPASLDGWRMPHMFPVAFVGGLIRSVLTMAAIPTPADVKTVLALTNYQDFQAGLEAGGAPLVPSGIQMHNAVHFWFGTGSHMRTSKVSSFDPMFWMHHANIDRLWAMWQTDGHMTEYPASGGKAQHNLNDPMYPWVGSTPGYSLQFPVPGVPFPDFTGLGVKRNSDTLDFRALGYSYDCIPIIGLALDRTGSMNELTPDPMLGPPTNITKWEAAKRGVAAFLQDCETVQTSGLVYTVAGIKTFRSTPSNQFDLVFGAPGFGLIKTGSSFSQATFNTNMTGLMPGGGTPLADALNDIQTSLVAGPFGNSPAGEQRYMAFLTDGLLTSGAPLSSIPNGSFSNTVIFSMGFGTGAEVDYPTLTTMSAKGKTAPFGTTQVFHGENAGTIDKFYSNALAHAIGFTILFDPLLELFAGEHTHLDFFATSADDSFLITAQGMDFIDSSWSFMLHGPGGQMLYSSEAGQSQMNMNMDGCHHCCPAPDITSRRSNGRLTLVIQRGNTGDDCWIGRWQLMISYKARYVDKMMMPELGELLLPVSAGPVRGPRYARLLIDPRRRVATRNIIKPQAHRLDEIAAGTNSNSNEACDIVVNIYGRTNLKMELQPLSAVIAPGQDLKIKINTNVIVGSIQNGRAFARYVSPAFDIAQIMPPERVKALTKQMESTRSSQTSRPDIGLLLATYEKQNPRVEFVKDNEAIVSNGNDSFSLCITNTTIPGYYHFGVYVEGLYFPPMTGANMPATHNMADMPGMDMGDMAGMDMDMDESDFPEGERFIRILNLTVAVSTPVAAPTQTSAR